MPIYIKYEETSEKLAVLAQKEWELPTQMKVLEQWLFENYKDMQQSNYVVDIGFSIRENALGGGAILSSKAMSIMGELGMNLYLSEYAD